MLAVHPVDLIARIASLAVQADHGTGRAVKLHDFRAARTLVESIRVLSYDRIQISTLLQIDQSSMGRVRLGAAPAMVPAVGPVLGGVFDELLDRCHRVGVEFRPQPTLAPEVRNPTFHGNSGPGEGYSGMSPSHQQSGLLQK
jgi:hypothetical protein